MISWCPSSLFWVLIGVYSKRPSHLSTMTGVTWSCDKCLHGTIPAASPCFVSEAIWHFVLSQCSSTQSSGLPTPDSIKSFRACLLFFKYALTCALNSQNDKSYLTYSQFSCNLLFTKFIETWGWELMSSMLGSRMPQYPCNMLTQMLQWAGFGFLEESHVAKKNGFYLLAFLMIACMHASLIYCPLMIACLYASLIIALCAF